MYESSIDIIYSDMQMKLENEVCTVVQNVGINVDKDELIKALSYDRQQYEKGYADAKVEQQWIPCSERLPEEDGNYLVTYEKGYAEDYGFDSIGIAPFEVDCEGFGIWQEEFDRYTLGILGSDWVEIKVIAWRPLPEPWDGEDNGQTD